MRTPKTGPVIAIDGPAGAGKSTLAARLARELGVIHLNTGTMYRAVAREALRRGIDAADEEALAAAAARLEFSIDDRVATSKLLVQGKPAGQDLLTSSVESVVSSVARHPRVREVLRAEQRRLGAGGGVVEGRDIGTAVFPDADVKLFLQASPTERAARRVAERGGEDAALPEALARRDALDARTNPLTPAADAVVIDTSDRSPEAVLEEALAIVRRRLHR